MYKSLILAGVAISISLASLSPPAQANTLPVNLPYIQDQQQTDQRDQPVTIPTIGVFAPQNGMWKQGAIPIKSNCFAATNLCPFLFEAS